MQRSHLWVAAAIGLLMAGGCASLPYEPEQSSGWGRVSADYLLLEDYVRVELDARGRRLDWAYIALPDGTEIRPATVQQTMYRDHPGFGLGVGVYSGMGTHQAIGSGVGFGTRSYAYAGNILLWFDRNEIGPPPWALRFKLVDRPEATIVLPEKASDE